MSDTLLIWARGIHFGSGMILVGMVAFRWLILLPAFAGEPDEVWRQFAPLFHRLSFLFVGAGILLLLSGLLLFWAVTAGMSGSTLMESLSVDTMSTVLLQTQFGSVCLWRTGLALILAVMMGILIRQRWYLRRKSSWLERAAGLVATALVVSISLTGHAAATGGVSYYWRVWADAIHLFAATIWPTGLLPFALFLECARRLDDRQSLRPTLAVTARFSATSFAVVGVLLASGIANTCFIVGSFAGMIATGYGRLLCLKIALFVGMLGIAACNRYRILPLMFRLSASAELTAARPVFSRLRSFVLAEFAFAVAIVVMVSVLGTTPPPR